MRIEIAGTFHIGIWPDDDDDSDDDEGTNDQRISMPAVITKPMLDKAEVESLAPIDESLPSLPEKVRELVANRRKQPDSKTA